MRNTNFLLPRGGAFQTHLLLYKQKLLVEAFDFSAFWHKPQPTYDTKNRVLISNMALPVDRGVLCYRGIRTIENDVLFLLDLSYRLLSTYSEVYRNPLSK